MPASRNVKSDTNSDTKNKRFTEGISFGEWLRIRRHELDLTQQALADQIGFAKVTLRRIESGALKPSKDFALILFKKLGIPKEELADWIRFARSLGGMPSSHSNIQNVIHTNLPASITSFVGREKEQNEIIKLIKKHRLVTLTGAGGVGKTRLAIKVGKELIQDFPDGVWLIELAALENPDLLPETISMALGIRTQTNVPAIETLANFIRTKSTLLILDNCEHLSVSSARLADMLLKASPDSKLLTTSRELLGIMGEAVYHVRSLTLPIDGQSLQKFRKYEAIQLFEERAQLINSDFSITADNASSVAQICSRLDGIPLAIELASVHVGDLSPAQIASQLEQCFDLLSNGNNAALPRQQTIRASLDWSWHLLNDSEKTLLRRLSIFAGSWTLELAIAIFGKDAAHLNATLTKKSLVTLEQANEYKVYYHLHEMVRQYAYEKLTESGEEESVRCLHLQGYVKFTAQAGRELIGPQQREWANYVREEIGNLRSALGWASQTDLRAGLALCGNLGRRFWENFDVREGMDWLSEFLQRSESQNYPLERANALHVYGGLLYILQQFEQARKAEEEAATIFHSIGNTSGEIDALIVLGSIMQYLEGMDRKIEILKSAYRMAKHSQDPWRQAKVAVGLAWDTRDLQRSYAFLEEAIPFFRQVGDLRMLMYALSVLSHLLVMNGESDRAEKWLKEALELHERSKGFYEMEFVLTASAYIALEKRNFEQARAFLMEWIGIAEKLGNRMEGLWARARLGYIAIHEGNFDLAHEILGECAREFQRDGNLTGLVFIAETAAGLSALTSKADNGAKLIGWAEATRQVTGDSRPKLEETFMEKSLSNIHSQLNKNTYTKFYESGRTLTTDQVIQLIVG